MNICSLSYRIIVIAVKAFWELTDRKDIRGELRQPMPANGKNVQNYQILDVLKRKKDIYHRIFDELWLNFPKCGNYFDYFTKIGKNILLRWFMQRYSYVFAYYLDKKYELTNILHIKITKKTFRSCVMIGVFAASVE